jgi:hypothetical protein
MSRMLRNPATDVCVLGGGEAIHIYARLEILQWLLKKVFNGIGPAKPAFRLNSKKSHF